MTTSGRQRSQGLLGSQFVKLIVTVFGVAATYFLTIQSLRLELAAKAETTVVTTLDKKLGNIEVILTEGVVSKEEFYQFSKDLENRLTRIEYLLLDKRGTKIEKP